MARRKTTKSERVDAYVVKDKREREQVLSREMVKMKNLDPIAWQQSLIKARIRELKEDLPHLHGWKWYPWAKEFLNPEIE